VGAAGFALRVTVRRPGHSRLIAGIAGAVVCVAATSCASGPADGSGGGAPPITILTHGADNDNGDIFIAPEGGGYANGPEILTNAGQVVWFHPLPDGETATDFRTQTYLGQPVLTWFQGGNGPGGTDEIYNDRYQPVAAVKAAPGQVLDHAGEIFAWQHDPEAIGGGEYTFFDDESGGMLLSHSRVVTVRLDLQTHVATLVRSDDQPEGLVAGAMGNAQTTRNGDLFVGWGALPYISEFSPSGKLLFNAELPNGLLTYRAYRLPWHPGV